MCAILFTFIPALGALLNFCFVPSSEFQIEASFQSKRRGDDLDSYINTRRSLILITSLSSTATRSSYLKHELVKFYIVKN